jgi:Tfp pilus assembly protein PilN
MKAVNLIPGERRRKSRDVVGRSGGAALIVLGLLAGLIALVVMYGSSSHQISSQAGEAAELTAKTSAVEARTGRLSSYTSFVAMAEQRMRTVSQLVESRFDWSHALHELGRVMPAGTALDSLHGAVGSAGNQVSATSSASSSSSGSTASTSVTSSTPPGSMPTFTLSGCATSQATVAQTLQRLRLMDGVSEVQLQSSTSSGSSSGGSASAGGGSCPAGDPSFTVDVGFAALPAAPAISAPAGVTPAAAHGQGVKVQVSVRRKEAPR